MTRPGSPESLRRNGFRITNSRFRTDVRPRSEGSGESGIWGLASGIRSFPKLRDQPLVGGPGPGATPLSQRAMHRSCKDGLDDPAGDVGEAKVAALEAIDEPPMIDAEKGEDGGVQVVDRDHVVDGGVAEFVG